jgi:hypothetical protein
MPQPLYAKYGTVVLDGSGNGTASIGPVRTREHWQVAAASVAVNLNPTKQAQCQLYVGAVVSPTTFISQTVTGSSGDTCGLGGIDIQPGMQVWAKWTGGDAGQTATVTVIGTYTLGAPQ